MQINATLIVQAFNFGLAYCMLRYLVFKPGVALVLEERSQEARLQDEIRRTTEFTKYEQERLMAEWVAEQQRLSAHIPTLPEELYVVRSIKPRISVEKLPSHEELAHVQKIITQSLVFNLEAKR